MSATGPITQTVELPGKIVEALSSIGYQVVPLQVIESDCPDCHGLGYDPRADGWQTCQVCQGWRVCRWLQPVAV